MKTFVNVNFVDGEDDEYTRIVLMLYYALTTLSTVGYGDYYPISDVEMIVTSLVMLGGVAFFSYIMGNFLEIISNYDAKMGTLDKSDELNTWITSIERFTTKTRTNLSVSLVGQIISDENYLWENDRLGFYDNEDKQFQLLPEYIKTNIIYHTLFNDIFDMHHRFFTPNSKPIMRNDIFFLVDIAKGLIPRRFLADSLCDRVIYEEDQEVAEMYFVQSGFIGIGINEYGCSTNSKSELKLFRK